MEALAGPGLGRSRPAGRRATRASPGWANRAWSTSLSTRTTPRAGCAWSSSVSYGKATAYLPVCDLLKTYCHIEDRDDLRTVRAKITGHILTLDEALQDTVPAVLALFEALPATVRSYPWIPSAGGALPWRR